MADSAKVDTQTRNPPIYPSDLWTLDDKLGLGQAGDQVARIALEAQAPFTLGVTGKWGSGKTSVMRRAFFTLGGHPIQQKPAFSNDCGRERNQGYGKNTAHSMKANDGKN